MSHRFTALRTWAKLLMVLGVVVLIGVATGVIGIAVNADSFFWEGVWTILIGGPIAILLSLGTLAVGQALLAIVEIYENTAPRDL